MSKGMSPQERAMQIELLRARAALERQSMVSSVRGLSASMRPKSLLRGAFPRVSMRSASNWAYRAIALTRRYPLLTSSASALLSGVGRKRRWWRLAAGLLISVHMARTMSRNGD